MANIYSSGIKLTESQMQNIRENTAYLFSQLGIGVKSLASGRPIPTNLSQEVIGPFSYRTARKFLTYVPGTEISKKSCDQLLAFYNTYFEPAIYGSIADYASHSFIREAVKLKPCYQYTTTDRSIASYADFFSGLYYVYTPSATLEDTIRGGVIKIYEEDGLLKMIQVSRIHTDQQMDFVMDLFANSGDIEEIVIDMVFRNQRSKGPGKNYMFRQGVINIEEESDLFYVILHSINPGHFPLFLSFKDTALTMRSYHEFYGSMGLAITHSADRSKMTSMKIAMSKHRFSLEKDKEILSRFLYRGQTESGINNLTSVEVTEWIRYVEKAGFE